MRPDIHIGNLEEEEEKKNKTTRKTHNNAVEKSVIKSPTTILDEQSN